jgi:hypothetical protein
LKVSDQLRVPAALTPGRGGGCMCPRTGLDEERRKFFPLPGLELRLFSPQPVAIPTALCRLLLFIHCILISMKKMKGLHLYHSEFLIMPCLISKQIIESHYELCQWNLLKKVAVKEGTSENETKTPSDDIIIEVIVYA